jgi:lipoprotein
MKKFFFIFVLYWLYSCNGTEKAMATSPDTQKTSISEKQNAEKIERIIYSETGGDTDGKNVHLVITKDSIIYRLTEGVTDERTIADLSLNNNNKDWEAFIDKIDLEDFEKGKPSEELIMDLPTIKIIIKTDKKEYSKTDIQANKTWDYITKQIIDIKYSQLYNHLNLEK